MDIWDFSQQTNIFRPIMIQGLQRTDTIASVDFKICDGHRQHMTNDKGDKRLMKAKLNFRVIAL